LRLKEIPVFPRQLRAHDEPLEGAARFVVDLDSFGAYSGFAFELLGRHKKIQQRNQGRINGGQEGLFLKTRKPVAAGIFTDDGSIFLFDKAGVVFPVVAAAGEGEGCLAHQISAAWLINSEPLSLWNSRSVLFDVREGIERP
jgi:hypothetical protein